MEFACHARWRGATRDVEVAVVCDPETLAAFHLSGAVILLCGTEGSWLVGGIWGGRGMREGVLRGFLALSLESVRCGEVCLSIPVREAGGDGVIVE